MLNADVKSPIDFSDLDDLDKVAVVTETRTIEESVEDWSNRSASSQGAVYEEKCTDCRGTGSFYSWSGRYVGPCFRCKGKGKLSFRTSPESRAAAKDSYQKRKQRKAQALADRKQAFLDSRPDIREWFEREIFRNNRPWDLAVSYHEALGKYGSLTPNQIAVIEKSIARHAERVKKVEARAAEDGLDLSALPSGYYAVPDGETRLKVRVNRPGRESNWHGWIFVSDGAAYGQRQNYGRQGPGKPYTGKIVEQLRAIMANPAEASMAYGKLVGCCGVCGRKLEDEESVERGIGPVCARKMGW